MGGDARVLLSYLAAILSVVAATLARMALEPSLVDRTPLATFYIAVAVTAWYGGVRPSVLAVLASVWSACYFFIPPAGTLVPNTLSGMIAVGLFLFFSGLIVLLSEWGRRNAAQAHQQRERFFRTLASIGDGVIVIDNGGKVLFLNQAAEQLTGWSADEASGQRLADVFRIVDERTDEAVESAVMESWRTGDHVNAIVPSVLIAGDGSRLPIDSSGDPIRDSRGRLSGAVLVFRDATATRKAEDQLRRSESHLTQELQWMNRLYESSLRLLQATDRSEALEEVLRGSMELLMADKGDIRLLDRQRDKLEIAVQQGFSPSLYEHFIQVGEEGTTFHRVLKSGERVMVEDVQRDAGYIPHRAAAAEAGYRAVMATPLINRAGELIGVLSNHFASPHVPSNREMRMLDLYARQAADFLERFESEQLLHEVSLLKDAALASLQASEEQFRQMANSIPQLAWMATPDGEPIWYNQRWYDYTGATPQEMLGDGWTSFVERQELPGVERSLRAAIAQEIAWEATFPLRRHDGAMRWHLTRALPIRDATGSVTRWFGTNTDITERRRTEAILRFLADASQSLSTLTDYRSTLEQMARLAVPSFADWCMIDLIGADGALECVAMVHADPEKVKFARQIRDSAPPRAEAIHGLAAVSRSGEAELVETMTDAVLRRQVQSDEQFEVIRQWGVTSMIRVPIAAHDKSFGVLSFSQAESNRHYDESDLEVAEDLARRAAVAIENARLYEELREQDHRKDEFLAMLAHELRNPLAPIRLGLDLLAMNAQADQSETITLMQQQVEHLVRLVDDLLNVSRIMRGKVELHKQLVELSGVVNQSVQAIRPAIDEQQQQLVVHEPDEPIWLNADRVRLVQVLENLLHNASKFTDPGGHITITAERRDGEAVVSVRDTGSGIDPDMLTRVFDLFTQSSRSLDRSQGGLGIGLTLVRNLVVMHGGQVSAHSAGPGQGSEFIVRLPVAKTFPSPKKIEPVKHSTQGRRILVVDDNVGAAYLVSRLFNMLGDHEVKTVHDGPAALRTMSEFQPELVLLDIGLPGMDGYEVGSAIRAIPEYNRVLLVALTGYGQEEHQRQSMQVGFDEHLVKPPAAQQLGNLLVHPKLGTTPQ